MEGRLLSMERQGTSAHLMNRNHATTMRAVLSSWLPEPLVYAGAFLSAADSSSSRAGAGGGIAVADAVDRLSALPDNILRDIVSRLPVKDAARTAVLSPRWLPLWRSTPLVLIDDHLIPAGAGAADAAGHGGGGGGGSPALARQPYSGAVAAVVSRVLEAHPGPFRCVDLTTVPMAAHRGDQLARWLYLLAVKRVEELIFVNRPLPLDVALPVSIFSLPSVRRLHLGVWRFPSTEGLPSGVAFPNLQELRLGCMAMDDDDLAFVLARSPVLETLLLYASQREVNIRIVSGSLWSVQLCMCILRDVAVVDAPRLERLLLWETISPFSGDRARIRIKIVKGRAPNLRVVGFLEPGVHVLEVGDTVIKIGTKASANTIIPSVKILALKVRFGVLNEAKMLPSFLRCFPNIETLHIESRKADQPTGTLRRKFWQDNACTVCVQSHIKVIVFHEYWGKRSELAFIKFILENAKALQEMVIVCVNDSLSSWDEAADKLTKDLSCVKWASQDCNLELLESFNSKGSSSWSCQVGSNSSVIDPFEYCY